MLFELPKDVFDTTLDRVRRVEVMDTESLTVSSVPESSEEAQLTRDSDATDSYNDEAFESESKDDGSMADSSSSEKYALEAFEVEDSDIESLSGGRSDVRTSKNFEHSDTERHDYADESFEEDEREASIGLRTIEQPDDSKAVHQEHGICTDARVTHREAFVGTWCVKTVQKLRAALQKRHGKEPLVRKSRQGVDKIPAAVVQKLLQQARCDRTRAQQKISWLLDRQQSPIPNSFMQRAQTQRWIATSGISCGDPRMDSEPLLLTSAPSTFCSVKCRDLQGRIATSRSSEQMTMPPSRKCDLDVLDLVDAMAARQREICAALRTTEKAKGRALPTVAMTTQWQLKDVRALRTKAEALLANDCWSSTGWR